MKKLILIGAGGHAKSVADSINKSEYELCGFIDSNKKGMHMGLPILGRKIQICIEKIVTHIKCRQSAV